MFAERLRELRRAHNYTQLELSHKLDVAKSTIAGYEKGIRKPKLHTVNKMAKLFNTSSDYLLGITDDKTPKEPSKDLEELFRSDDYTFRGNKVSNEDLDFFLTYLEKINRNIEKNPDTNRNNHDQDSNSNNHKFSTKNESESVYFG